MLLSLRRRRISYSTIVCAGIVFAVPACRDHGQEASSALARPIVESSASAGTPHNALAQKWTIKPPEARGIDPDWPRRVANVVGFAPPNLTEDYTAHIMDKPTSRAVGETLFVVRRRKNWVRIDEHFEGQIATRFINLTTGIIVSADGRNLDGQPTYLGVDRLTDVPWDGQGRLISLQKGQLRDADVAPPENLFEPENWAIYTSSYASTPSYAVVLQGYDDRAKPVSVSERRRGNLVYREEVSDTQRLLSVKDHRMQLFASYTLDGQLKNIIVQTFSSPPAGPRFQNPTNARNVLGETCRFVERSKSNSFTCLASDGATLIDGLVGRGSVTAVSIERNPLPLNAVLPPPELFTSLKP